RVAVVDHPKSVPLFARGYEPGPSTFCLTALALAGGGGTVLAAPAAALFELATPTSVGAARCARVYRAPDPLGEPGASRRKECVVAAGLALPGAGAGAAPMGRAIREQPPFRPGHHFPAGLFPQ